MKQDIPMLTYRNWSFGPISGLTVCNRNVPLSHRQKHLLELLLQAEGRCVDIETLARAIWTDSASLSRSRRSALTQCIASLRSAFGPIEEVNIETVNKSGYRVNITIGDKLFEPTASFVKTTSLSACADGMRSLQPEATSRDRELAEILTIPTRGGRKVRGGQDLADMTPADIIYCTVAGRIKAKAVEASLLGSGIPEHERMPRLTDCALESWLIGPIVGKLDHSAVLKDGFEEQAAHSELHYFVKAWSLVGQKSLSVAMECLNEGLSAFPTSALLLGQVIFLYCARGDLLNALDLSAAARRLHPNNNFLGVAIAVALCLHGKVKTAARFLSTQQQVNRSCSLSLVTQAWIHARSSDRTIAINLLERIAGAARTCHP